MKTVGSWESGSSAPTISNFITLCSIYKKSFDELYFVYDSEVVEVNKKKKLIPILVPISLLVLGGTGAGIAIGVTANNKKVEPSINISISEEHVHHFSTNVIQATYEADGSITYSCECGYSYTVILPQLVHIYSETYSYNNHYHYRSCLDEGYEDLYVDKDSHDIVSIIEGNITTYSCSICDFSYTTNDYIVVIDLLNSDD